MAHGTHHHEALTEKVDLAPGTGGMLKLILLGVGVLGLAVAYGTSAFSDMPGHPGVSGIGRFYHAYLVSYAFVLSLALGGLFFTMMQHLVAAGWSVVVRRIAETMASALPLLAIGAIPILVTVLKQDAMLYPWAVDAHSIQTGEHSEKTPGAAMTQAKPLPVQLAEAEPHATGQAVAEAAKEGTAHEGGSAGEGHEKFGPAGDIDNSEIVSTPEETPGEHATYAHKDTGEMTHVKHGWLNTTFFAIRIVGYFVIWSLFAWYFYSQSKKQDATGDYTITQRLRKISAPAIFFFALAVTFGAFDLLMSLDHHWYSTMFGVYFFAGAMIAQFATIIIVAQVLQNAGYLRHSITREHFHDLGKFMFAFIFFWGYVGFSQYMLQWYASIPEATPWWSRRGATVASDVVNNIGYHSEFGPWSLLLLCGHFVFPFAYLLSRHVKRHRQALLIGAIWMLAMHWVDMFWIVMPELDNGKFFLGLPEIGSAVGLISLFASYMIWKLGTAKLRPVGDPRLNESLAFHNM
ncbi:MAG: hypothetical protein QM770_15160 [Tepidisphaeraceae bacterium]